MFALGLGLFGFAWQRLCGVHVECALEPAKAKASVDLSSMGLYGSSRIPEEKNNRQVQMVSQIEFRFKCDCLERHHDEFLADLLSRHWPQHPSLEMAFTSLRSGSQQNMVEIYTKVIH